MDIKYNFDSLQRDALENIKQVCVNKNIKGYIVGGAVRDALLDIPPRDVDICLELDPKELLPELDLEDYVYYDTFQTATATFKNGIAIDLTRCRKEKYESEGSLPEVFPSDLSDDLKRRDFTVNAIAYDLVEGKLIDPYQGVADIKNKIIKSVHGKSYSEDPTRIFRAVKYAVRYSFEIKDIDEIKKSINENVLKFISNERYYKEIFSICCEEKWCEMLIKCNSMSIFKIDIQNILKRNFLADYRDANVRMLNFAYCIIGEDEIRRITDNSYIQKDLKKSLQSFVNGELQSLLLKAQDNYEIYSLLSNSSIFDRILLCYNYKLVYKLINFSRYAGFKLSLDGSYIKNQGVAEGMEIGEILGYIARIKLNIGISDERKYFNENLGEILDAVKYKA